MGERQDRFTALFQAAYGPLWAYARRRVPAADVDDVVADAFAVAWRRLEDVPGGEGALPWLYGVAYRTIANSRRSAVRRHGLLQRLMAQPAVTADTADSPVLDALANLAPAEQEILRLSAWEGLGPAEIAAVLGCTPNAAALRLSRARARLRERMTESAADRTHAHRKEIDA